MAAKVQMLVALGALTLLASCEQAQSPQLGGAEDDVLRATDSMKDFGDYVVYVNALTTDQLTPEVAGENGIVRSRNRAMLTLSVHKKQAGAAATAVNSEVSGTAVNLTGQLKNVLMREIAEGDAIYYIGELEVNNGETLIYSMDVTPAGETDSLSFRFQKQFFINP